MNVRSTTLDSFLGSVLRGAAKILGCGSTSLIFINEETQRIGIRLGTMQASNRVVAQVERALGGQLGNLSYPLHTARDSLVYRAWRERTALETSSLRELVGGALPQLLTLPMSKIIGEHRFICVPALSGTRNYGVILFQKEGPHPFNRQQREVILRYARRIGEILENDAMGQGRQRVAQLPAGAPDYLLFDAEGRLLGETTLSSHAPDHVRDLGARAAGVLAGQVFETREAEFVPFRVDGRPAVLCRFQTAEDAESSPSLENQLLQLTLGDVVASLCLDTELCITSCNQAAEKLLGWKPSELVHKPVSEIFASPRQIVPILSQQILDPSNPCSSEATTVVLRDGTVAPARVEALPLADDTQQAVGFLLLLRQLDDDDPCDTLVQQERLASMGELAAQLAHEMRNPIVAVGANLESLVRDPTLSEEHRSILSLVSREVVRMDMFLKDYLSARHDMSFTEVDLAQLVEDARRLLEGACKLAGKKVTSRVEPGLQVHADYDSLKHVLFNLLLNALEASPPDGEVHCSATGDKHAVTLAIEDRGPGLAASPQDCFRPFFTTKKNGTGLGLAVCQNIARSHGGVVSIGDREGGGCRATVVLPRHRAGSLRTSA